MNKGGKFRGARMGNPDTRTPSSTPRTSIFSEFETVRLTSEERIFLNAARQGDTGMLSQILEFSDTRLNVNCVDYMGRNALHLAIDSDTLEAIEIIMESVNQECIEEALLHAISKGDVNVVRSIIDHPRFMALEKMENLTGKRDAFFRTEETYQFSPDITPLILAAHRNNHEIIQLFLSRGHTIERPHAIHCMCDDCQVKQNCDSLKRSRSRLNAYKALASPAYMALSSPDPITTTFELRQEMKEVAAVEKEFKNEYLCLVTECMNFACELMDLCRGTQEVEAMLSEETSGSKDPMARLKLALKYGEKKFVAHPNCQQHLTSIWYGKTMSFMQASALRKKIIFFAVMLPLLPFLCFAYIISPGSKLGSAMRCPLSKFITHTTSHIVFLVLLAAATFNFEEIGDYDHYSCNYTTIQSLAPSLRSTRNIFPEVQILIMCWVVGLLWIECKQIYYSGVWEHFRQYYNFMDFTILALYISSYSLRYVTFILVRRSDNSSNFRQRASEDNFWTNKTEQDRLCNLMMGNDTEYYFLRASRFKWYPDDPEIVSEILFAVANVLSFARTTYVMPAHEVLGPLQISLGRMFGDITRFLVLFSLVLLAFMVGLTNLYSYYGSHVTPQSNKPASQSFKGLVETVHTLFFSIFGLITLDKLKISGPNDTSAKSIYRDDSTQLVDSVGLLMFAVYQVVVAIVLVNILIAMMSHSFEAIQFDNDVEWKFARTQLWMGYIEEGGTLPVPFNMIPSPKTFVKGVKAIKKFFIVDNEPILYDFGRRRENILIPEATTLPLMKPHTTFSDIVQRLVRRYLFKIERDKMDAEGGQNLRSEEYIEEDMQEGEVPQINIPTVVEDFVETKPGKHVRISVMEHQGTSDEIPEKKHRLDSKSSLKLIRKSTKRRMPGGRVYNTSNDPTLESIQRGQKMLDARLQDLQSINVTEREMKENLAYIKHVLIRQGRNMEKTMEILTSMKTDIKKPEGKITGRAKTQIMKKKSNKAGEETNV